MPRPKILFKLSPVRLLRHPNPALSDGYGIQEDTQKLAVLVQALAFAETAAGATSIPYLKGAISMALTIAECARGYQSNNESLHQLALTCGDLMVAITRRIESGPGISDDLAILVADLFKTLERFQSFIMALSSAGKTRLFLAQKDIREKTDGVHRDLMAAHLRFQTLSVIVKDQLEATQDEVYLRNSINMDEAYAVGNEWIAFKATLSDSGKNVIVKRYTSHDQSRRKSMHASDIEAFKKFWYPNCVEYMGGSHPREGFPYTVLKGVTSTHVSAYIALKLREDNRRGSAEALKFLTDLTNALSYIVGNTVSSSLDISKVHLTDSGKIVVVDLEPRLEVTRRSINEMPYWRSWQEICIELLTGDPTYEPNPVITYNAEPTQHVRLKYLRPILGHIHSGGLRFMDHIESAFRRQGLMLSQSLKRFENLQARGNEDSSSVTSDSLSRVLWHHSRELHYVAHFREPLDMDVGDIGYIIGNPPRFIRLDNVFNKISDRNMQHSRIEIPPSWPPDRWITEEVQGIQRHAFRFRDSDAWELADRPRAHLNKDVLLRSINLPNESGLVVDCSSSWDCLAERANDLAAGHTERTISATDLILVVYSMQQCGKAAFRMNRKVSADQWRTVWAREGFDAVPETLYFYESPPGGSNGTWGYFSFSPTPGSPHRNWTPERDDAGESWGWSFVSEDWTVGISKPNVKQYIRYVQL